MRIVFFYLYKCIVRLRFFIYVYDACDLAADYCARPYTQLSFSSGRFLWRASSSLLYYMVHLKKKLLEQPTPLGITFPVVYSIWPLLILCANVWVFFSYNFQFSFWFSPSSYRRCVVDFGFRPFSIYSSSFLLLNFGFRLIELPGYIHYNLCALQPTTVDVPVRAHVCVCVCVYVSMQQMWYVTAVDVFISGGVVQCLSECNQYLFASVGTENFVRSSSSVFIAHRSVRSLSRLLCAAAMVFDGLLFLCCRQLCFHFLGCVLILNFWISRTEHWIRLMIVRFSIAFCYVYVFFGYILCISVS